MAKRLLTVSTLSTVLILSGCAGMGPNERSGTWIGGAAGAIAGAQFGHGAGRLLGAGIGAATGAAVGNAVGRSMDNH